MFVDKCVCAFIFHIQVYFNHSPLTEILEEFLIEKL